MVTIAGSKEPVEFGGNARREQKVFLDQEKFRVERLLQGMQDVMNAYNSARSIVPLPTATLTPASQNGQGNGFYRGASLFSAMAEVAHAQKLNGINEKLAGSDVITEEPKRTLITKIQEMKKRQHSQFLPQLRRVLGRPKRVDKALKRRDGRVDLEDAGSNGRRRILLSICEFSPRGQWATRFEVCEAHPTPESSDDRSREVHTRESFLRNPTMSFGYQDRNFRKRAKFRVLEGIQTKKRKKKKRIREGKREFARKGRHDLRRSDSSRVLRQF
ncbi:hypothetical protein ACLOJK_029600 [Asimina triloba]